MAKKSIELGRDAGTVARDLGKVWAAIDDVKADAKNAKKGGPNSLEKFIALKKAEDLEHNLRNIIISTRGEAGWRQLKAMRQADKKSMELEAYAVRRRKAKIREVLFICLGLLILIGGGGAMIYFALMYQGRV